MQLFTVCFILNVRVRIKKRGIINIRFIEMQSFDNVDIIYTLHGKHLLFVHLKHAVEHFVKCQYIFGIIEH